MPESLRPKPNHDIAHAQALAEGPEGREGPSALAMRFYRPTLAQVSAMLPNLDPSTNGFH